MFIGMEQLKLSNFRLAGEALKAAYSMCDSDPLLINEMGVMAFNQGKSVAATACQNTKLISETTDTTRLPSCFERRLVLPKSHKDLGQIGVRLT